MGALFIFEGAGLSPPTDQALHKQQISPLGEHGRHGCANLKMVLIGLF